MDVTPRWWTSTIKEAQSKDMMLLISRNCSTIEPILKLMARRLELVINHKGRTYTQVNEHTARMQS